MGLPHLRRVSPWWSPLGAAGVLVIAATSVRSDAPLGEAPETIERGAPCPASAPPGMACVLGGAFVRGSDRGMRDERPALRISVDTFFMDVHEVTNEEFGVCVAAGVCAAPPVRFRGYSRPRQPVVGVSWYAADAFCRWKGKRLPTEAEFERAAGGTATTRYPWGDEPEPCTRAVVETRDGKGCGRGTTWDVMSLPPGHFGLYDIAGNVWEWTNDWYSACYDGCANACGADCEGHDPRGPCRGAASCPRARALKVVRGGSWWYPIERARASARRGSGAPNRGPHRFGFRCASDLE